MENQSQNFINLVSSYLSGEETKLNSPKWSEILRLAQIHSLKGVLYAVLKDTDLCDDDNIMKKLKNDFNSTIKYSVIQEYVGEDVVRLLNQNNIKHILFKGFLLRNYYKDKELRTMGDIDIIIEPDKKNRVHEMLLTGGYSYDEFNSHKEVLDYSKNGVNIEIHTKIIDKNFINGVDFISCFSDLFKNAELKSGCTYEFNKEFHFIYLIVHMAKHLKFGGCGVRMFMDISLFIENCQSELDWKRIKSRLEYLCLADFADNVFALCGKWFGKSICFFNSAPEKSKTDALADYFISGGTFGFNGKNVDSLRIGDTKGSLKAKIIGIGKLAFPDYEHLKNRYTWFENIPKWLLPVGWIRFWHFRIVKNKENSFKRLINAVDDSDAAEHRKIMDIAGLSNNKKS